jgi:uncharacterized protein YyaL (SSP411 family)
MPNRLAGETSPYLLQHKDNPVDWYPWGPEALERARAEDKPILLSIGYSACHWCHVMEHESFEDPDTAEVMNSLFVSIKVDREERPDLDGIYMQAVQMLTGHGGWPMTMFLMPDGRPYYGGTYFPREARQGMPAFMDVLKGVADAYYLRKDDVVESARNLTDRLQSSGQGRSDEVLTASLLQMAVQRLAGGYDWDHGGFGSAPKFPHPMATEFLLRSHHRQPDARTLQMVEHSLTQMANGGIYDQVGGGFHRYSTDAHWLVPHFEKMLYDNALLSRLYLHAYQITGNAFYRRVTEETLDYVLREMTDPSGGFYSTQDADSEGVEGKFFVWSPGQVIAELGESDGALFNRYYDVTKDGNFEGKSILNVPVPAAQVAEEAGVTEAEMEAVVRRGRERLYEVREQRVHPGRDEKVLTSWNGLMLKSFAEAAATLGRDDYRAAAVANAEFLLRELRPDGRLLRTWKQGRAKLLGFLEDYSMLIDGLITLYETTFDRRWMDEARRLADEMVELFWAEGEEVFYDTGNDHEELIVRPRDTFDNAMPCGNSVAADVLLRLALIFGEADYARRAASSLRSVVQLLANYPTGFGHWLGAFDYYLSKPLEIAVIGPRDDPASKALVDLVSGAYLPNKIVAGWDPADGDAAVTGLPLLEGRSLVEGKPAAYVCENYACQMPVTEPRALAEQLGLESA